MKSLIVLIIFFTIPYLVSSQVDSLKNTEPRATITDEVKLQSNNRLPLKIDTLYLRNLSANTTEKDSFWIQMLPILGVVIGGIVALIGQHFLKGQEKSVNSHNLKEAKRIQNLENVFQAINQLSLHDRNDTAAILQDVQTLEKYVNDNTIYIHKSYEILLQSICDYYREVSNDYLLKDYRKELEFSNEFKRLFNK